jgi:hypothetical protein
MMNCASAAATAIFFIVPIVIFIVALITVSSSSFFRLMFLSFVCLPSPSFSLLNQVCTTTAPAAATTTAEEVSKDEDENKESAADSIAEDESMASTSSITTKVHARDDGFIDQMVPWYDGFEGDVDRVGPHSFRLRGKAEFFEPDKKGKPGIISITGYCSFPPLCALIRYPPVKRQNLKLTSQTLKS